MARLQDYCKLQTSQLLAKAIVARLSMHFTCTASVDTNNTHMYTPILTFTLPGFLILNE